MAIMERGPVETVYQDFIAYESGPINRLLNRCWWLHAVKSIGWGQAHEVLDCGELLGGLLVA